MPFHLTNFNYAYLFSKEVWINLILFFFFFCFFVFFFVFCFLFFLFFCFCCCCCFENVINLNLIVESYWNNFFFSLCTLVWWWCLDLTLEGLKFIMHMHTYNMICSVIFLYTNFQGKCYYSFILYFSLLSFSFLCSQCLLSSYMFKRHW